MLFKLTLTSWQLANRLIYLGRLIKNGRLINPRRLIFIGLIFATTSPNLAAEAVELEFQNAAHYTHILWSDKGQQKYSFSLKPIVNYSGIPIEDRDEKKEYFYHGKLPQVMQNIFEDALVSSRYFNVQNEKADYQMALIIESYQLPYAYQPDDSWWEKLQGQTDRWLQAENHAKIKLTLKITSGQKHIKNWQISVTSKISHCDLNRHPQPQSWTNNQNKVIRQYLSSSPGQAFLAATNYLVLKAIETLTQQPILASVERKQGNEIYLHSENSHFIAGETAELFYNHPENGKAQLSMGQLEIIKAMDNLALAYPKTLRADHIREGDWVELPRSAQFEKPPIVYQAVHQCANVQGATNPEITLAAY